MRGHAALGTRVTLVASVVQVRSWGGHVPLPCGTEKAEHGKLHTRTWQATKA